MTDISYEYKSSECGWASDEIVLEGDGMLMVSLKGNGYVVVKKRNEPDGVNPKVYVSKRTSELELKISGDAIGRIIQVLTSEEPNYIRYAYI